MITRYPELSMVLSLLPGSDIPYSWPKWSGDPPHSDVLFIFGLTPILGSLMEWLKDDRKLIFIEDDLEALRALEDSDSNLFDDPRVHLKYLFDRDIATIFEESILDFPSENSEFVNLKGKNYDDLVVLFFSKLSLISNTKKEICHYDDLFDNLISNTLLLSNSFAFYRWHGAFTNIPAIVCGAGPSLAGVAEILSRLEDKALILAGGSAISALNALSVDPHLGFAFDPNAEELQRLCWTSTWEMPLIYGRRLNRDLFATSNYIPGYLPTSTGGALEEWMNEKLSIPKGDFLKGVSIDANSVTAIVLSSAIALGCNPVILAGVDLCYLDGARYSPGVDHDESSDRIFSWRGKETSISWIIEHRVLSSLIALHGGVEYFDMTCKGLRLAKPLMGYDLFDKSIDVRGMVLKSIEDSWIEVKESKMESIVRELYESLLRCRILVEDILGELNRSHILESSKSILWEDNLSEEIAYKTSLLPLVHGWCKPSGEGALSMKKRIYERLLDLIERHVKIISYRLTGLEPVPP